MKNLALGLLLGVMVVATRVVAGESNRVLVLETRDAKVRVDAQKLEDSVDWAVRELDLQGRPLPLIVVFHISPAAAQRLGFELPSLWQNRGDSRRYELWIGGEQSNEIYSQMAVGVLDHHFALGLDPTRRKQAIQVVRSHLDSTVSAKSLALLH